MTSRRCPSVADIKNQLQDTKNKVKIRGCFLDQSIDLLKSKSPDFEDDLTLDNIPRITEEVENLKIELEKFALTLRRYEEELKRHKTDNSDNITKKPVQVQGNEEDMPESKEKEEKEELDRPLSMSMIRHREELPVCRANSSRTDSGFSEQGRLSESSTENGAVQLTDCDQNGDSRQEDPRISRTTQRILVNAASNASVRRTSNKSNSM